MAPPGDVNSPAQLQPVQLQKIKQINKPHRSRMTAGRSALAVGDT